MSAPREFHLTVERTASVKGEQTIEILTENNKTEDLKTGLLVWQYHERSPSVYVKRVTLEGIRMRRNCFSDRNVEKTSVTVTRHV